MKTLNFKRLIDEVYWSKEQLSSTKLWMVPLILLLESTTPIIGRKVNSKIHQ